MLLMPRPLTLGGLDCVLFAPPDGRAAGLGVFCHGFGAPGDDLVPLGAEILGAPGTEALALLFPAAPVSLAAEGMPGGRAWWPLDMSRLQTGAPLDAQEMAGRELPGSAEAAALLGAAVTVCAERLKLEPDRVVLGGFSQGAMVAADCAFRSGVAWAGLCLLSGAPMALARWRRQAKALALAGRPMLQSARDPWTRSCRSTAPEMVRDTLSAAGMSGRLPALHGRPHDPAGGAGRAAGVPADRGRSLSQSEVCAAAGANTRIAPCTIASSTNQVARNPTHSSAKLPNL